jgi:hypothetical protein
MKEQLTIDVAVICQEYSPIEITCSNSHTTTLDDIEISEEYFKKLFYPYGENFGMDKTVACKKDLFPYVSFIPPYRSIKNKNFFLLETILSNIESDLNLSRNCFSTESVIELTNELIKIHSLCDINCCSVLASLPWSNIQKIISDNKLHSLSDKCVKEKKEDKILCFVITIIFKTPTQGVKPNMIKFPYVIKNK